MAYTKKDQLIDRINDNYTDFKASLRGVSRETLFNSARRIAAVTDAYEILTADYRWDESMDSEVDFYLLFRDPLTIIADAWEKCRNENKAIGAFAFTLHELPYDERLAPQAEPPAAAPGKPLAQPKPSTLAGRLEAGKAKAEAHNAERKTSAAPRRTKADAVV